LERRLDLVQKKTLYVRFCLIIILSGASYPDLSDCPPAFQYPYIDTYVAFACMEPLGQVIQRYRLLAEIEHDKYLGNKTVKAELGT